MAGKVPAVLLERRGHDAQLIGLLRNVIIVAERALKARQRDGALVPLIREIRMLRNEGIDHAHHVPVGDDVHAAGGVVYAVHQLAAIVNEKLLGVAVAVGIGHVVH